MRVTVYFSSRVVVGRTLYDIYCLYFSPEVMVKFMTRAKKHLEMLIENCNSRHICNSDITLV